MSKIVWRDDIANAPKDKRLLMIATPIVPSHDGTMPEIIVAHWYLGTEQWVVADTFGESRRGARLELNPIYWAELCELPAGVTLRRLDDADFKG
jgi:hypothetical protein